MTKILTFIIFFLIALDIVLIGILLLHHGFFPILDPKGIIARQEKQLLLFVLFLGLSIIIPTLIIAFYIPFHFHDKNTKGHHAPDAGGNTKLQAIFWIFPSIIVCFLSFVIWNSTHALDPHKSLTSTSSPITIQVVALQWKWLFIYPQYNIATVNYVAFPKETPVTFELTAEAPMSSFWIPQLGGQMYAMEGMVNQTHLMADSAGEFAGSSAEISGVGFADMKFVVRATTDDEFNAWVESVQNSPDQLTLAEYNKLAKPSTNNKRYYYSLSEKDLYNKILMKYMAPTESPAAKDMHMDQPMQGMKM